MFVEAKTRKDRKESLLIFCFTSIDEDFKPFIEEMEKHADAFLYPHQKEKWLEIIGKIKDRCDDKYAHDNVVASACLFANEAADYLKLASYLAISL